MSAASEVAPSPEKPAEKSGDKSGTERPASPDEPPTPNQILNPGDSRSRATGSLNGKSSSISSMLSLLAALALAAAGAWILIQRRQSGPLSARGQRRLQIEETRPLGGRQYLIVANYDGKKFLLGVTPGRINLLTPLDDPGANPEEKKP